MHFGSLLYISALLMGKPSNVVTPEKFKGRISLSPNVYDTAGKVLKPVESPFKVVVKGEVSEARNFYVYLVVKNHNNEYIQPLQGTFGGNVNGKFSGTCYLGLENGMDSYREYKIFSIVANQKFKEYDEILDEDDKIEKASDTITVFRKKPAEILAKRQKVWTERYKDLSSDSLVKLLRASGFSLTEVSGKSGEVKEWLQSDEEFRALANMCLNLREGQKAWNKDIPIDVVIGKFRKELGYPQDQYLGAEPYHGGNLEALKRAIAKAWGERNQRREVIYVDIE